MTIRPRHLLVIRTDHMGDTLMTLPAIAAVKTVHPECRITVLGSRFNAEVLLHHPAVDAVEIDPVEFKDAQGRRLDGIVDLILRLRRLHCDVAILMHRRTRWALAMYAAGIPVRIGFARRMTRQLRGIFLTKRIDLRLRPRFMHESGRYLELFEPIGVGAKDIAPLTWPVRGEELAAIDALLLRHGATRSPFVVLHPGNGGSALNWSPAQYGDMGARLAKRGFRIAVTGGAQEIDLTRQVSATIGPAALDLGGQLALPRLAALMKRSVLYVGSSTGTTHFAAAVGIPVLALYSLQAAEPRQWRPLCKQHKILQPDLGLECLRCLGRECPDYHCMERHLSVAVAERAALDLIEWDGRREGSG